ncbi:MAG: sulfatase [Planctomycetes bacterium]|nr:sulfatase [Planctomycetota bacterium]
MSAKPLARRIPFNVLLGFCSGWAVGALESVVITGTSQLVFPNPLFDSLQLGLRYGLLGAAVGLVLAFFPARLRPNRAASVLFTTFSGLLFVTGTSWIHQFFYGGVSPLSFGPLAANGLLAGACLAAGYGLGRMPAPIVTILILAIAGHGGVAITAAQPEAAASSSEAAAEGAPNVLFILVDTLRADHLQSYGYPKLTSPTMDGLAQQGVRFDRAYAQATWTRPSVASLMTSLYPASHLTNSLHVRVPSELQTLAETVDSKGYTTASFSANRNVSEVFGFDQGFDTFWTHASDELNSLVRFSTWERVMEVLRALGLAAKPPLTNQAAKLTDRVLAWTQQHDGSPYFLYVQYIDPHGPYEPPAEFLAEIGVEPPGSHLSKSANPVHGKPPYPFYEIHEFDQGNLGRLRELYDAEILYCDREIGRLLDSMRAQGLLENTYIVITSDHGEEFWEHKQFGHGQSAFEELARVPLIIAGPGIGPGVVRAPVELIDLYPTIATWVGAAIPDRIQGQDLGGLIAGGGQGMAGEALISNLHAYELTAWVLGHEKLVRIEVGGEVRWLLYDLESDPLEQTDLAALRPERLAELKNQLLERRNAAGLLRVGQVETAVIDRQLSNELGGLGYTETGGEEE